MKTFTITKASASHLARWYIERYASDPAASFMVKTGCNMALKSGFVEKLFDAMYSMGFRVSADESVPAVQAMLANGSIQKEA